MAEFSGALEAVTGSFGNVEIGDTLTMGTNGSITNSNDDYILDEDGLSLFGSSGSTDSREIKFIDNEVKVLSIFANISSGTVQTIGGRNLNLVAPSADIRLTFGGDLGSGVFFQETNISDTNEPSFQAGWIKVRLVDPTTGGNSQRYIKTFL